MSRWSRDALRIALAPHGLALLRPTGGSMQSAKRTSIACDTRDWQSLMPLLERELADPAWHGTRAEVVLSNQYVRYVLTPPPGKALGQVEEEALVGASFREIYGAETANWRISVISQPPSFGLLGAAIDETLALHLAALFQRTGFKDWSLNPLASFAAHHNPHKAADWWVLVEPGWMCLFHAADGYWRYLNCQPVDANWRTALPDMLEREARMAGSVQAAGKSQIAFIQSVGLEQSAPPVTSGWHWRMAAASHNEHGVLALAMA